MSEKTATMSSLFPPFYCEKRLNETLEWSNCIVILDKSVVHADNHNNTFGCLS